MKNIPIMFPSRQGKISMSGALGNFVYVTHRIDLLD
jgi:hypothetical protein